MMSLAADIGGTYSRLAWFGDNLAGPPTEQVFKNADFDSLEAVIERGRNALGQAGTQLDRMVLAVPGPVHRDPIELTNIRWQLRRDSLSDRFGVKTLTIVNDFQAAALGAINEAYENLVVLNPATPDDGPIVVAGAGTGLGMAWLTGRDQRTLPQATEGGHMDFAPNSAEQMSLYQSLAMRHGHVSYERVLSGDGLLDTYRHLSGINANAATPAEIASLAGQQDRQATAAVRLFVDVFAAYAGNLALAFNPLGGIYLCGGLAAHLADWFDPASFQLSYTARGRMADVVRRVPVYLVTEHATGLRGAVQIARLNGVSPWA